MDWNLGPELVYAVVGAAVTGVLGWLAKGFSNKKDFAEIRQRQRLDAIAKGEDRVTTATQSSDPDPESIRRLQQLAGRIGGMAETLNTSDMEAWDAEAKRLRHDLLGLKVLCPEEPLSLTMLDDWPSFLDRLRQLAEMGELDLAKRLWYDIKQRRGY